MSGASETGSNNNAAFDPEGDLPPEDPRLAQMRRLVTILLGVLIVGVCTVVIALLVKLKDFGTAPGPSGAAHSLQRPIPGIRPGEKLVAAEADIDRITLMLEDTTGARRAIVIDARTFAPIGALADTPE